jgi:DNA-3-methyladenine glycosylase II
MLLPQEILSDKKLACAIRAHGPLEKHAASRPKNPFHSLIRAIVYQQVSGKAAQSILKKFKGLFGNKFPTPKAVLEMPIEKMRAAGLSGQKTTYIRDLALKFTDGTIHPRRLRKMTNEDIIEHLVRVKGIGIWSAQMFLLFTLKRPDILPTLDLGIRKGFQVTYDLKQLPDHPKMERLAKNWRMHASFVSLYLWRFADKAKEVSSK